MRDVHENGHVEVRSQALIDELAVIRRGELNDSDLIAASAGAEHSEGRVLAMGMAVEQWFATVQPEIQGRFAPKERTPGDDNVATIMIGNYLERVRRTGRA